jgi:exopolysaccharide biosynthesis polyprenyl glycosylphosphotransferase
MLRQNLPLIRGLHVVVDLGMTFVSFHLACLVQGKLVGIGIPYTSGMEEPYQILLFLLPVWAALLLLKPECYEYRGKRSGEILRDVGIMVFRGFALLVAVLFFTKTLNQSRALVLTFLLMNLAFLSSLRIFVSQLLGYLRRSGYNLKNILIVGTGAPAREFLAEAKDNPEWGFRIIRLLDWEEELDGKKIEGFLKNEHVDYVVFAVCKRFLNLVEGSLLTCEEMGVPACLLADFFALRLSKKKVGEFQKKPALMFSTVPDWDISFLLKSIGDRLFALGGIILFSPLLLFLSALVKLTSRGSVFFRQERCGLNGRRFIMFKFRTMVENADGMKELLAGENEMDGPAFKMSKDPRLTKVGRILRKSSLDELPQLFNVLRGEMSLVGPRPPLGEEVSQYDLWQRRRLSVKPGLTCLWQVNGRNNVKFEKWMEMDLEYIDNWSLWLDAKIMLRTIPAVLLGIGAK